MLELCVSSEDKKTKSWLSQQQSVHQIVLKIAVYHVSYDAGEECSHIQWAWRFNSIVTFNAMT